MGPARLNRTGLGLLRRLRVLLRLALGRRTVLGVDLGATGLIRMGLLPLHLLRLRRSRLVLLLGSRSLRQRRRLRQILSLNPRLIHLASLILPPPMLSRLPLAPFPPPRLP